MLTVSGRNLIQIVLTDFISMYVEFSALRADFAKRQLSPPAVLSSSSTNRHISSVRRFASHQSPTHAHMPSPPTKFRNAPTQTMKSPPASRLSSLHHAPMLSTTSHQREHRAFLNMQQRPQTPRRPASALFSSI